MMISLLLRLQIFQNTFIPINSHNLLLFLLNQPNLYVVITQWSVIYNSQTVALGVFYVTKSLVLIRGEIVSSQAQEAPLLSGWDGQSQPFVYPQVGKYPILEKGSTVLLLCFYCSVTLRGPPLYSETWWTGELWSNTNLLKWQD